MANAGRVLILAKGAWSATTNYVQLDMVSHNSVAYLARQASVGVDPSTDVAMNYWMPFGSAAQIATTSTPGLVMPDGTTITITNTGLIKAVLGIGDITGVTIASPTNGQVLKYNSTTQKWENSSLGTAANKNATSAITSGSTDLIEAGAVYSANETLTTQIGTKQNATDNSLATTDKTVVGAINEVNSAVSNKHKVTRFSVSTSGWTSDTTSQSGTTLYKKSVSLSHVYTSSPSVDIGATGVLPTTAQQEAYNLLQYVTCDSSVPCLYLYASEIPSTAFYINVEGVD